MSILQKKSWWSPEFVLVIVMLVVLTILVIFTLSSSMPNPQLDTTDPNYIEEARIFYETTLDYRRNLLAIILTAFGAWVGAGAAYFFGRENLRESAQSLLSLHRQMTGQDKLKEITVKDLPPKPLDIIIDETTAFRNVIEKFTSEPKRWFIPIQTSNKWVVINDETFYIYMNKKLDVLQAANPTLTYAELKSSLMSSTMKEVLEYIRTDNNLMNLLDQFIPVTIDANVAVVNDKMEELKVFLGLVMDESGKFTHYFTTNDIRKALLKI